MALSKESQWIKSSPSIERSSGHFHDFHYPGLIEQQRSLPTETSELSHLNMPACMQEASDPFGEKNEWPQSA